jgi:hypothetical protein
VQAEAHNPGTVKPGQLRKVIEIDQGGTKITKWIGQQSFVKDFTREGRRVKSFNTPSGKLVYVDKSGHILI